MAGDLRIKFKGEEYILMGDLDSGGAITTPELFSAFDDSYAHLFPDGVIKRYCEVIGSRDDIEVLGEPVEPLRYTWEAVLKKILPSADGTEI